MYLSKDGIIMSGQDIVIVMSRSTWSGSGSVAIGITMVVHMLMMGLLVLLVLVVMLVTTLKPIIDISSRLILRKIFGMISSSQGGRWDPFPGGWGASTG